MSDVRRVIGIDLGTTNSCVATVIGGFPQVIPNVQGYKTTPSVLAFMDDDQVLIGQHAKRQALINPKNTIFSAKRLIGRRFTSKETRKVSKVCPYEIEESDSGGVLLKVSDQKLRISEVSAKILEEMKRIASNFLADDVKDAVITVPAYFNDGQRQATKEAGELAGLNVLRIINEPTAAALAYGHAHKVDATVAVYDLGGGTFDISVLEIKKGVFKVLATAGDTFLGGDDFDDRIIDEIAGGFLKTHNIDLRREPTALQRLKDAAEQAKCELSLLKEVKVSLPFVTQSEKGPVHLERTLTRDDLDRLSKDLIQRTLDICAGVVKEAGLDKGDIDDVLLVGGQTRMPRIQDAVANFFGRSANKQVHPEEAVAIGAAIHADSLLDTASEVLLLDVTPMGLGIRTAGNTFSTLIPKNSTVPISKGHTFTTVNDNQQVVKIEVYQGDSPVATENELLGQFLLTGIREAPASVPEIEVEFNIDANGIVHVSATDLETGLEQSITLMTGQEDEASGSLAEAPAFADESEADDFDVKLSNQTKSDELEQAVRLSLHRLRKQYEANGHGLKPEDQKRIVGLFDNAPGFLKSGDMDQLGKLKREISRALQLFN